jgi:hypothetical protein
MLFNMGSATICNFLKNIFRSHIPNSNKNVILYAPEKLLVRNEKITLHAMLLFALIAASTMLAIAQVPYSINYQAVAHNAAGQP